MEHASDEIRKTVQTWKDVTIHPHRFGGIEFRLGKRELGHLHGDSLLDIPFPIRVKEELVTAQEAQKHHIFPDSGWISYRIRSRDDIEHALDLLHRSFEIAVNALARRTADNRFTIAKGPQE